jgi:LysM repeat protein/ABC-type branched-subunit amino acid transport system substrate-binding protein
MGITIGPIIEMYNNCNITLNCLKKMRINVIKVTLLFLFAICSIAVAQDVAPKPIVKSNTKVNIDGKSVYIHKVEQGQTLYGIGKAYNVLISDIELYNDSLQNGLKTGMELKIPANNSGKSNKLELDNTGKFIMHKVEKKQTLYAISKKYNVSIEAIQNANPEIYAGLSEGVIIKIPQKEIKTIEPPVIPVLKEPKSEKKSDAKPLNEINVNLFLPFYLYQNDSILNKDPLEESDELYAKSIPGIEFLSGFQLACDSIINSGVKVNISVYDTPADSAAAVSFFANKQFKNAALWFGPFHSHAATAAAKAIKSTNALLVLPFASPNKVLLGNENVIKLSPSMPTGIENMTIQLITKNKNNNLVLVHNALSKELQIVEILKKTIKSQKTNDSLKEIIYKTAGLKGLTNALSKNKDNLIVVASSDQAFVTDLFNKLKGLDEKDYKITVVGMESWINYDNLDINMIQKFGLQIPANAHINYNDSVTNIFIKSFREKYHTEPGKYAFSGYDAAFYFIPLLAKFGHGVIDKLEASKSTGLITNFNFKKTGDDSGFENQSVFILKYEDFELKKQ